MSTASSIPLESKSAKKRKAKTEAQITPPPNGAAEHSANGSAGDQTPSHDHPYVHDLEKKIRNEKKKLTNLAKTETLIAEHPGKSLDALVASKTINNDQKAQILKKPQLEGAIAQLEAQLKMFLDIKQDFEARSDKEKAALTEAHEAEVARIKEDAQVSSAKALPGKVHEALSVVSSFLHAAAAKRQSEEVEPEESRAYEGVLFHLYQGNAAALQTMVNLVEGSSEKVRESGGDEVDFTFQQLRASAVKNSVVDVEEIEDTADEPAHSEAAGQVSDPTITNAGLTELEDTAAIATADINGDHEPTETPVSAPEQTSTTADAANAMAEASWDPQASAVTDTTQSGEDWVQVPRDPAETETGTTAPAAQQSTSNWADEAAVAAAATEEKGQPPAYSENDGFSEVRRERGGRGRGGPRGGRGFDGRGRGRGRGEFRGRGGRGGRGGPRGSQVAQPAAS